MRRQRRMHTYDDEENYPISSNPVGAAAYQMLHAKDADVTDDFLQMEIFNRNNVRPHRFENTIEAKVEDGDTLQALALRFHCSVADIKRLNKIDKENEIHARKVVKIPVTVHSVLLNNLPTVHKSGNSSPKSPLMHEGEEDPNANIRNPLEDARIMLDEKLMVASVNSAGENAISTNHINNTILNSSKTPRDIMANYTDKDTPTAASRGVLENDRMSNASAPLLSDVLHDDDEYMPRIRPIRGPSLSALDWSGSDCDMSWVCLFVVILALCFVVPLVYVFYIAEHSHHHNSTSH